VRITYSPRAIADLGEVASYLIARSPSGARAVEKRIRKTVALLAQFAGRVLEQRPAVRVIPLGRYPYLIFYSASEDELIILHVRHGARRPVGPESL
jgi:toxin ParE1/3/4